MFGIDNSKWQGFSLLIFLPKNRKSLRVRRTPKDELDISLRILLTIVFYLPNLSYGR